MLTFLKAIEQFIVLYSGKVPLEWFIFLGSIIEEIIAPIPSPLVPTTSGSLAAAQGGAMSFLLVLALIGSLGKLIGASVVYVLADKLENIFLKRFGKMLGITHEQMEHFGRRLEAKKSDMVSFTILRMMPVVPSVLLSVVAGTIKIRYRVFLASTLIGTYFRDLLFLYFGYAGLSVFGKIVEGISGIETMMQIIAVAAIAALMAWFYARKKKQSGSVR